MPYLIDQANRAALERLDQGNPALVDVVFAKDVLPGIAPYTIGHAGPPIAWEDMCGPMKGAILGAIRYEELAETDAQAAQLIEEGKIKFRHNHSVDCVGPMTGIITYSMPLIKVANQTYGNVAYSTFNEGLGKVMRFGANGPEVIERLRWIEQTLAPAFQKALIVHGSVNLKVLMSKALAMGDEMHQRNIAASALLIRELAPSLACVVEDRQSLSRIMAFLAGNDQLFLNVAMAASKSVVDAIRDIPYCSLVSAMSRNGSKFGIKVSALGDRWFEAPCLMPKGLYFPGYGEADANPDMGDSAICETYGIGGFAMASAPAVVRFVSTQPVSGAFSISRDMAEITAGTSTQLTMPNMDFLGIPMGIDIRKVVETGLLPVINTGIAHKEPGVGQIGAGMVHAPMDCFEQALIALGEALGV